MSNLTEAIDWFNTNFGGQIRAKVAGTPFKDYFLTAIALKETYYIWSRLMKKSDLNVTQILDLCVGDIIDAPRRSAFPVDRAALEATAPGRRMFQIAHQCLLDLNVQIADYRKYTNDNKFCRGYGIFQYDLQHFKTSPDYFLNKKWKNFDDCLDMCLTELTSALKRTYGNKTALTDLEMVYVAIAYNRGSADLSKGFNQGHNGTYGTEYHDYLIAAKTQQVKNEFSFPVLRMKSTGVFVKRWQQFLMGQGFDPKGTDSTFGKDTRDATIAFQKKYNLDADGEVGNDTYGQAAKLGFKITADAKTDKTTINFPPKPSFSSLTHDQRVALFGSFKFKHQPVNGNYENIKILDGWDTSNIVSIDVPQLIGIRYANAKGTISVNKKIAAQVKGLWQVWGKTGLLEKVLTWEGAFVPRFKRGKALPANINNPAKLSNHSWGTAFDINAQWNGYGEIPALVGKYGCIRELVEIANDFGFYWGGHFTNPLDGMHFEIAVLKTDAEVQQIINKY